MLHTAHEREVEMLKFAWMPTQMLHTAHERGVEMLNFAWMPIFRKTIAIKSSITSMTKTFLTTLLIMCRSMIPEEVIQTYIILAGGMFPIYYLTVEFGVIKSTWHGSYLSTKWHPQLTVIHAHTCITDTPSSQ
jgi:hypothetical protein